MKEIEIYGDTYEVIKTEDAKTAIREQIGTDEVKDYTPRELSKWDTIWWRVMVIDEHTEVWMNNCHGQMIILTDGDESYLRYF